MKPWLKLVIWVLAWIVLLVMPVMGAIGCPGVEYNPDPTFGGVVAYSSCPYFAWWGGAQLFWDFYSVSDFRFVEMPFFLGWLLDIVVVVAAVHFFVWLVRRFRKRPIPASDGSFWIAPMVAFLAVLIAFWFGVHDPNLLVFRMMLPLGLVAMLFIAWWRSKRRGLLSDWLERAILIVRSSLLYLVWFLFFFALAGDISVW